ncbi:MAG TPA: ornithine carbamoyltransferase [Dehalococcoidia bacterium]|nr:ornithine carbamoyltransferase [Dehalococcoidia bacterium]
MHLLSISDLTAGEIRDLISQAGAMKGHASLSLLAGRSLGLLFERPSLRTRVSFEVAMYQLGGHSLYLSPEEVGLGYREAVGDVGAVLGRYIHGMVARVRSQPSLQLLAQYSPVPVINGLSDEEHPCQALSDLLTISDKKGELAGRVLTYVGDGNNVAHSLLLGCCLMGMEIRLASPRVYQALPSVVAKAQDLARSSGGKVVLLEDTRAAMAGADVVYTDVWYSMGHEEERDVRRKAFAPYQVTRALMAEAKPDALFMHCLPAHRGEEVTDEVIDGPRSVVLDQAENRLHMQKAILAKFLK